MSNGDLQRNLVDRLADAQDQMWNHPSTLRLAGQQRLFEMMIEIVENGPVERALLGRWRGHLLFKGLQSRPRQARLRMSR